MKKLILSLPFLLLILSPTFSQEPAWVNAARRNLLYPESKYLIGFSAQRNTQKLDETTLLNSLESYAKEQLVQSIVVDLQSKTTLNILNVNAETLEELQHSSSSFSQAEIVGLKTERYYDPKKKEAYVMVYAAITDVLTHYGNKIKTDLDKLSDQYQRAEKNKNKKQFALKEHRLCYPIIRDIEASQALMITLTSNINDERLQSTSFKSLKNKIDEQLKALSDMSSFTLADAANYLAEGIIEQLKAVDKLPIKIQNFTFQDTPMGSPFSRKLTFALEQKLAVSGIQVLNAASTVSSFRVLGGTYWEEGDKIRITSILRTKSGGTIAGTECTLPITQLTQSGIAYKPENYTAALVNSQLFAKDELKGGDLKVDILTNKGNGSLIFTEGETLKLLVRANRECYLRFIYHLADGSKVLLLDNYYVNRDKVNQFYELPYEFECAEPFGVETLQLNAQSKQFDPLATKTEYGYDFILESSEAVIKKTRGFKRKVEGEEDLKAEKRVVFTTMKR